MGRLSEARKTLENMTERECGVVYTLHKAVKKTTKNGQTYAFQVGADREEWIWSCTTLTTFIDEQFSDIDELNDYLENNEVTVVFDETVSQKGRTYISFEIWD